MRQNPKLDYTGEDYEDGMVRLVFHASAIALHIKVRRFRVGLAPEHANKMAKRQNPPGFYRFMANLAGGLAAPLQFGLPNVASASRVVISPLLFLGLRND